MSTRRKSPFLVLLAVVLLAACGRGSHRTPSLAGLPLVGGAHVVTRVRACDPGANAYCAEDLVVASTAFASSQQFLQSERDELHKLGWTGAYAPNGDEHAADSPGGKLHLVYATAQGDLTGIDFRWIQRPVAVAHALSRALFKPYVPTLSMQVESGSA
jgi:hypothetical protein